jgi:hypothetical protein
MGPVLLHAASVEAEVEVEAPALLDELPQAADARTAVAARTERASRPSLCLLAMQ